MIELYLLGGAAGFIAWLWFSRKKLKNENNELRENLTIATTQVNYYKTHSAEVQKILSDDEGKIEEAVQNAKDNNFDEFYNT